MDLPTFFTSENWDWNLEFEMGFNGLTQKQAKKNNMSGWKTRM